MALSLSLCTPMLVLYLAKVGRETLLGDTLYVRIRICYCKNSTSTAQTRDSIHTGAFLVVHVSVVPLHKRSTPN